MSSGHGAPGKWRSHKKNMAQSGHPPRNIQNGNQRGPMNGNRPNESSSDDDSSARSEDSDAELLTSDVDFEILHTISLIKAKDARVYDKSDKTSFIPSLQKAISSKLGASAGAQPPNGSTKAKEKSPAGKKTSSTTSHVAPQNKCDPVSRDDAAEDADFFTVKEKTDKDKINEEADYIKWLKGQEIKEKRKQVDELATLKRYLEDESLSKNEVFLRDYVIYQGWKEKDGHANQQLANKHNNAFKLETLGAEKTKQDANPNPNENEDHDDDFQAAEEFEQKFNFRFEEKGAEKLISYPKNMPSIVRNAPSARALKRDRKKLEKTELKLKLEEQVRKKAKKVYKSMLARMQAHPNYKSHSKKDLEALLEAKDYDVDAILGDLHANSQINSGDDDDLGMPHDDTDLEAIEDKISKLNNSDEEDESSSIDGDGSEAENDEPVSHLAGIKISEKIEPGSITLAELNDPTIIAPAPESLPAQKTAKRSKRAAAAATVSVEDAKVVDNEEDGININSLRDYVEKYLEEMDKKAERARASNTSKSLEEEDEPKFTYRQIEPQDFGLTLEEMLYADEDELNKIAPVKDCTTYLPTKFKKATLRTKKNTLLSIHNPEKYAKFLKKGSRFGSKKHKSSTSSGFTHSSSSLANNDDVGGSSSQASSSKTKIQKKQKRTAKNTDKDSAARDERRKAKQAAAPTSTSISADRLSAYA